MNVGKQPHAWTSLLWFVPVVVGCVAVALVLTGGGWWARLAALIWFIGVGAKGATQGARKIVPLLSAPDDVDALSLSAIADRLGALREEIKRLEDIEATYVENAKKRLPQGETLVGRMFTVLVSVTKRVILDTDVVKTLLTPGDLVTATKEIEVTTVLIKRR